MHLCRLWVPTLKLSSLHTTRFEWWTVQTFLNLKSNIMLLAHDYSKCILLYSPKLTCFVNLWALLTSPVTTIGQSHTPRNDHRQWKFHPRWMGSYIGTARICISRHPARAGPPLPATTPRHMGPSNSSNMGGKSEWNILILFILEVTSQQ